MSRWPINAGWTGCFLSLLLAGCGGTAAPTSPEGPSATSATPEAREALDMAAGSPGALPGTLPTGMPPGMATGPASTVTAVLRSVKDGRLDRAYDFLPARYQQDVDQLLHEFARKMDAGTWEKLFGTLQKGATVLRQQKALILDGLTQPGREAEVELISQNWDGLVDAFDVLLHSELSDLERLKSARMAVFLEQTANPLFAELRSLSAATGPNAIDQLSEVQVEIVEEMPERAVMLITGPNESEPTETVFVVVEGKWVPESMASTWDDGVAAIRQRLQQLTPESMAAQKEVIEQTLTVAGNSFDQMLKARKPEELQAAAFPLLFQGLQLQEQLRQPVAPMDGVTVIILTELDEDVQTQLLQDMEKLTDRPEEAIYLLSPGGGETTITLRPVQDPVAFAEKLTFAKTKVVDVNRRTIRITVE